MGFHGSRLSRDLFANEVFNAADGDDLLDERGERRGGEALAGGSILDHAGIQMDGHLVAVADGLGRRRTLDDRQADINRVAVEDAGEAVRDDELNTAGLDGDGRVLAGGAAAEVAPRDDDAARFAVLR